MADENNNVPATAGVETVDGAKSMAVKKSRSPKREKAAAEKVPTVSKVAAVKPAAPKRKTYSEREKAEKLNFISTQVVKGKAALQEAIKSAGISVQTYYQWKRSDKPADKKAEKTVSSGHDLAELVQLEEENQKLRAQLAEKLRAENVELRKRLGLN
jgi:putative transposase